MNNYVKLTGGVCDMLVSTEQAVLDILKQHSVGSILSLPHAQDAGRYRYLKQLIG